LVNTNDPGGLIEQTPERSLSLQETKPRQLGHIGRGGFGNYMDGDQDSGDLHQANEVEMLDMAHKEIVKDVEKGLREPEKAHLVSERIK